MADADKSRVEAVIASDPVLAAVAAGGKPRKPRGSAKEAKEPKQPKAPRARKIAEPKAAAPAVDPAKSAYKIYAEENGEAFKAANPGARPLPAAACCCAGNVLLPKLQRLCGMLACFYRYNTAVNLSLMCLWVCPCRRREQGL